MHIFIDTVFLNEREATTLLILTDFLYVLKHAWRGSLIYELLMVVHPQKKMCDETDADFCTQFSQNVHQSSNLSLFSKRREKSARGIYNHKQNRMVIYSVH